MSDRRQVPAVVIALGLCASLTCGATQAHGEEGSSFIADFTRTVANGIVGAVHDEMKEITQSLVPNGQLGASDGAFSICKVVLAEDEILRKIASDEFTLQEGVTLHPSRGSTLQHGVSLSRSFESLIGGGIEVGANGGITGGVNAGVQAGANAGIAAVLKADIGARVADMLSSEIQESSSIGMVTELDGNALEKARITWYARIRLGKAILQANGVVRELPFEYIVGYKPDIVVTPRRRSAVPDIRVEDAPVARGSVGSSLPRFGRVTAVSKEWPRLFEARFETAVTAAKDDRLPVYRGHLAPKCVGCCKVVAVRDCQVVGECEGFTPQVGDTVAEPVASATGPAR